MFSSLNPPHYGTRPQYEAKPQCGTIPQHGIKPPLVWDQTSVWNKIGWV